MNVNKTSENTQNKRPLIASRNFWVISIILVIMLGGVIISISQPKNDTANVAHNVKPIARAGYPAPDFELKNLAGETVRLSDFKGLPVIVNFWATWCAPCKAEFPDFQKFYVDNADKVVIIGINNTASDQIDQVREFVAEMGVTYTIVLDEDGSVGNTYRLIGLPTTIFIDRDGIINELFTGPLNKAYLESKISEL